MVTSLVLVYDVHDNEEVEKQKNGGDREHFSSTGTSPRASFHAGLRKLVIPESPQRSRGYRVSALLGGIKALAIRPGEPRGRGIDVPGAVCYSTA